MRHRSSTRRMRRSLPTHDSTGGDHINLDTARDNLCAAADHVNDDDPRHHHLVECAIAYHHALDDQRAHPDDLDTLRAAAVDAVLTVIASSWQLPAVTRYITARTAATHEVMS